MFLNNARKNKKYPLIIEVPELPFSNSKEDQEKFIDGILKTKYFIQ